MLNFKVSKEHYINLMLKIKFSQLSLKNDFVYNFLMDKYHLFSRFKMYSYINNNLLQQ